MYAACPMKSGRQSLASKQCNIQQLKSQILILRLSRYHIRATMRADVAHAGHRMDKCEGLMKCIMG